MVGKVVEALFTIVEESPEDDQLELTASPISIERTDSTWLTTTVKLHACTDDGVDVEFAAVLSEFKGVYKVTGFVRRYDDETGEWPNFQGCDEIERRFDALVAASPKMTRQQAYDAIGGGNPHTLGTPRQS